MKDENIFLSDRVVMFFYVLRKKSFLMFKRLFDIFCALFCCFLLIPVTFIIKVSYLFSKDYDSVFFVQKRIGKNGKEFNLYKYRTMVVNADEVLQNLLKSDKNIAREYKKNKKLQKDPRITKVGKFLRRTSLDEFPQFVNILKGDMSLIGNRPYLPREKEDMGENFNDIVKTKPGLTGLWQVSGKEYSSFESRMELEKKYSKECSFKLDVKIFFKTFKAVLTGHGAGL